MRIAAVEGHFVRRSTERMVALSAVGLVVAGCVSLGARPAASPVHPALSGQVAAEPASPQGLGVAGRQGPNIVLITTDDQNSSDLRWMPRTRHTLGQRGMAFTTALSPQPLCCPA